MSIKDQLPKELRDVLDAEIINRFDSLERMAEVMFNNLNVADIGSMPRETLVLMGDKINDLLRQNQQVRVESRELVRKMLKDAVSAGIAAGRAAALSL